MNFAIYSSFFLLSTIKFLFTPFAGPAAGLSFIETYFSCVLGGIFSASIFYFSSGYFIKKSILKQIDLKKIAQEKGEILIPKKKFTKTNKFIVSIKRRFGLFGVAMYAPLFLSVPIGSIITAKFFGHLKKTFGIILLGMFVNGLITTGIAYGIALFFK
jgi:hypothetical protein